ncbi:hypothetical protein, partial [Brevibacterium aurantiacum]|uniref:hypothetical protein n=1 Tax=Brevibacterium aurantiacum TaxID=273384 RepID=UPI003F906FAD
FPVLLTEFRRAGHALRIRLKLGSACTCASVADPFCFGEDVAGPGMGGTFAGIVLGDRYSPVVGEDYGDLVDWVHPCVEVVFVECAAVVVGNESQ